MIKFQLSSVSSCRLEQKVAHKPPSFNMNSSFRQWKVSKIFQKPSESEVRGNEGSALLGRKSVPVDRKKHQPNIDQPLESTSWLKSLFKRKPAEPPVVLPIEEPKKTGWFKQFFRKKAAERVSISQSSTVVDPKGQLQGSYSRNQWSVLVVLILAALTTSFGLCLFPPFFPKVAESKGASASVYGFIIGVNCLTAFIIHPIIGKYLYKFELRIAFVCGWCGSGLCCFLSGLLEFIPSELDFVLAAILIRMTQATSIAFVLVGTSAYIASEFPQSVAKIFSFTRAMTSVAQLIGPIVGGALYEAGGFKTPFIFMGLLQVFCALASLQLLPEYHHEGMEVQESSSLSRLLKTPRIWIPFSNIIFATMSTGFLSVTLEPQVLRHFNLTPFYVGLVFGLKDGANAAFSPIWGYLSHKAPKHNKLLIFLAASLGAASFVLLGPFPGLPIKETLAVAIVALIINGIASSGQQVAGMVDALKEAINSGHPDSPDTHSMVSGVWNSLSGGGRFISRCSAGILVDSFGFSVSSTIIVVLQTIIAVVALAFSLPAAKFISCCRRRPSSHGMANP